MGDESINALVEALKKLSPQAPTTLVPPSFDWSSKDQYDDFQLFIKSVNSWFTLQGIAEKAKGPDDAEIENPIRCRIYKLEETRILPGESLDKLVDRLRALADRCNFPSDDEKERNVQYRLVRALDDRELVKKLLAMPITATTAKMLETCRTHIAINGEMDAMGLGSSKDVHTIRKGPLKKGQGKGQRQGQGQKQQQQHSLWKLHQASRPRALLLPSKRRPMPSMWEDWTLGK